MRCNIFCDVLSFLSGVWVGILIISICVPSVLTLSLTPLKLILKSMILNSRLLWWFGLVHHKTTGQPYYNTILGSIETDRIIIKPFYNEDIYGKTYSKIIIFGAMTWPCYIENRTIVRRIIIRLKQMKYRRAKKHFNKQLTIQ